MLLAQQLAQQLRQQLSHQLPKELSKERKKGQRDSLLPRSCCWSPYRVVSLSQQNSSVLRAEV